MIESPLEFKIATEPCELEQIHRLNYRTFVEEIPQHDPNEQGALVDKFDRENLYFIARRGARVVGMIAFRARRPFSLDQKLEDLDRYLPAGRKPCEIRLLAVEKDQRGGAVLRGLVEAVARHGKNLGCDLALISGTVRQRKLYEHLGFVPFGPLVGANGAEFQPMYLTLEQWERASRSFLRPRPTHNLLPGPVAVLPSVRRALRRLPVSHRAEEFLTEMKEVKRLLCERFEAGCVEILVGSGTLANDAVAAQLSLRRQAGLILSNGEFGERLQEHARRFGLKFHVLRRKWGEPFEHEELRRWIARHPQARWLWAVHCETSSGVLNDLPLLAALCRPRRIRLCLDCIGSVGTMPVSLKNVFLATATSGKGLAAFPGLALVFSHQPPRPAPRRLPRYLDLGEYARKGGVPFTASSNLLGALHEALRACERDAGFDVRVRQAAWLRPRLRAMGFRIVAPDAAASPAVTTIALPASLRSEAVGAALEREGIWISYRSDYLLARNWVQICLMGAVTEEGLNAVVRSLQAFAHTQTNEQ